MKGLLLFEGEHAREQDTACEVLSYNANIVNCLTFACGICLMFVAGCSKNSSEEIRARLAEFKALRVPTEFSELRGPRPADADNAAILWAKGSELGRMLANVRFPLTLGEEKGWSRKNRDLFVRLDNALSKPMHYSEVVDKQGSVLTASNGASLKAAMKALTYRAKESGWPGAKLDLDKMERVFGWANQEPFLIDMLIAVAVDSIRVHSILDIACLQRTSISEVKELRTYLEKASPLAPLSQFIRGEFCFNLWQARNYSHPSMMAPPEDWTATPKSPEAGKPFQVSGIPSDEESRQRFLLILDTFLPYFKGLADGINENEAIHVLEAEFHKSSHTELEKAAANLYPQMFKARLKRSALHQAARAYLDLLILYKSSDTFPQHFVLKPYSGRDHEFTYMKTEAGFVLRNKTDGAKFRLQYPR